MPDSPIRNDVTVVIPSYRRPEQLVECVESITDGSVLPGTVLIVHRETDEQTAGAAQSLQSRVDLIRVNRATVDRPGHLPPVEKGVEVCETEFMVLLDDDTVVKERWLSELIAPLDDLDVGVVGGPAVVPGMEQKQADENAGCLRFYGQIGGGLMWATDGETREVDTVPEGNSAWRTDLLRSIEIPPFLYERDSKSYGLHLTLSVKERGYKVLFNPEAFMWHYPGRRDTSLERTDQHRQHWLSSRNYALIALNKMAPRQAFLYFVHAFIVGTYGDIGILRALYMLVTGDDKWDCVFSCGKGRIDALRQYFSESRGPQPVRN